MALQIETELEYLGDLLMLHNSTSQDARAKCYVSANSLGLNVFMSEEAFVEAKAVIIKFCDKTDLLKSLSFFSDWVSVFVSNRDIRGRSLLETRSISNILSNLTSMRLTNNSPMVEYLSKRLGDTVLEGLLVMMLYGFYYTGLKLYMVGNKKFHKLFSEIFCASFVKLDVDVSGLLMYGMLMSYYRPVTCRDRDFKFVYSHLFGMVWIYNGRSGNIKQVHEINFRYDYPDKNREGLVIYGAHVLENRDVSIKVLGNFGTLPTKGVPSFEVDYLASRVIGSTIRIAVKGSMQAEFVKIDINGWWVNCSALECNGRVLSCDELASLLSMLKGSQS